MNTTENWDNAYLMDRAKFIEAIVKVRFWEDATVNGRPDTKKRMPFRISNCWTPVIELATGRVLDWPEGVEANVFYEIGNQDGSYWLLNSSQESIVEWKAPRVPEILCIGRESFGEYICLNVGKTGVIADWKPPRINARNWVTLV